MIDKLLEYGIIVRVGEGYDYSAVFKESYHLSYKAQLGAFRVLGLSKDVAGLVTPTLAAHVKQLEDKRQVRELTALGILLVYHLKRINDTRLLKDKDSANILYELYVLDKTLPDLGGS